MQETNNKMWILFFDNNIEDKYIRYLYKICIKKSKKKPNFLINLIRRIQFLSYKIIKIKLKLLKADFWTI